MGLLLGKHARTAVLQHTPMPTQKESPLSSIELAPRCIRDGEPVVHQRLMDQPEPAGIATLISTCPYWKL